MIRDRASRDIAHVRVYHRGWAPIGFVADLPPTVDPCGENGEFHSFVYDGPIFQQPLTLARGGIVTRDNRHYIDLLSLTDNASPLTTAAAIPPL